MTPRANAKWFQFLEQGTKMWIIIFSLSEKPECFFLRVTKVHVKCLNKKSQWRQHTLVLPWSKLPQVNPRQGTILILASHLMVKLVVPHCHCYFTSTCMLLPWGKNAASLSAGTSPQCTCRPTLCSLAVPRCDSQLVPLPTPPLFASPVLLMTQRNSSISREFISIHFTKSVSLKTSQAVRGTLLTSFRKL